MTLTLSPSWGVELATPGGLTPTTLVPLGALSEALPPLLLANYGLPDPTTGNWSAVLETALEAGFDRILIDGPPGVQTPFVFDNTTISSSCEIIFGDNAVVAPLPPTSGLNYPTFCFNVTADNVTIRGLTVQAAGMLYVNDEKQNVSGFGANIYCQITASPNFDLGQHDITVAEGGYYTEYGSTTPFNGTFVHYVLDNLTGSAGVLEFFVYNGVIVGGSLASGHSGGPYIPDNMAAGTGVDPYYMVVGRAYPTSAIQVAAGVDGFTLLDSTFVGGGSAVTATNVSHMRLLRCHAIGFGANGVTSSSMSSMLAPGIGFNLSGLTDCWVEACHAEAGQAAGIAGATLISKLGPRAGSGFRLADTLSAESSNLMFTNCISEDFSGGVGFGGAGFDGTAVDLNGVTYLACISRNNYGSQFSMTTSPGAIVGVKALQYIGCTGAADIDGFPLGFFQNGNPTPFELFVEGGAYSFDTGTDNNLSSVGFFLNGLSGGSIAPNISWAPIGIQLAGIASSVRIRPQAIFARIGIEVVSGAYPREVDLSGSKVGATAVGLELDAGSNLILDNVESVVEGRRIFGTPTFGGAVTNAAAAATIAFTQQSGSTFSPLYNFTLQPPGVAIPVTSVAGLSVGARILTSGFPSGAAIASVNSNATIVLMNTPVIGTFTVGATLSFESIIPVFVNGGGIALIFGAPVSSGVLVNSATVFNPGFNFLGGTLVSGTVTGVPVPGVNPADPGAGGLVNLFVSAGTVASIGVTSGGSNYLGGASGTYLPKIGQGANLSLAVGGATPRLMVQNGGFGFIGSPAFNVPQAVGTLTFTPSFDMSYGMRMSGIVGGQISNGKFQGLDAGIDIEDTPFGPMITGVTAISQKNTAILPSGATPGFQGDANSLVAAPGFTPALPTYTVSSGQITIGGNLVHVVPSGSNLSTIRGALADGQIIFVSPASGTVTLTDAGNLLLSGGTVALSGSPGPILMLQWNAVTTKWLQVAPVVTDS